MPGKLNGEWVFRGTRMPVDAVFANLRDGFTVDEVVEMFDGLTHKQVNAVVEFARGIQKAAELAGSLRRC